MLSRAGAGVGTGAGAGSKLDQLHNTANERLWVIRSDRSGQMSDCERIAQVTHVKRATVSESLRLFMTKEQPWANSLRSLMINERWTQKIWLKLYFLYDKKNQWFAHSLFFNERCELIAQVAHQKWVTMSKRSGPSPKMSKSLVFFSKSLFCSFFWEKNSNLLRKMMSKFQALVYTRTY